MSSTFLCSLDLTYLPILTLDHSILLSRLHHTFGISGTVLSRFQSYLSDRTQVVSVNGASSATAALNVGVPQALGAILFVLYTHPFFFLLLKICPLVHSDTTINK